jgi:hypothetical protein
MNTIWILLFCVVVSAALTMVFLAVLGAGLKRRNERRHRLGRLLRLSHPEWN